MSKGEFGDWLNTWIASCSLGYLKRLSGNDTYANESHQAGPYFPKELLFEVFPSIYEPTTLNPRVEIEAFIDSQGEQRHVTAIWYNNFLHEGTRNEARVTNWGGVSSAVLNPDSTGALAVFLFVPNAPNHPPTMRVWVCSQVVEEDLIESRVSPVDPGHPIIWRPSTHRARQLALNLAEGVREPGPNRAGAYRLAPSKLPSAWLTAFPTGVDIVRKVCELSPAGQTRPDDRLIRRRDYEYQLFRTVEDAIEGHVVAQGFTTVAEFLTHAQRILQRRKARSGRSLELQTREILMEEGLVEGQDFSYQPESEDGKQPDFLFPSEAAYRDPDFPVANLRLLAAKTTCKDRWRQVINEADRIKTKHLLTLQEGVSENQFAEMAAAGVRLVVPRPLIERYPKALRKQLVTFGHFLGEVRSLADSSR